MNKQKYLISNVSMILILFLVALYQFNKLSSLSFLDQTSFSNDIGFTFLSIVLVITITLVIYYVPMLLMFEYELSFNIPFSPEVYISKKYFGLRYTIKLTNKKYLRLNVIRC